MIERTELLSKIGSGLERATARLRRSALANSQNRDGKGPSTAPAVSVNLDQLFAKHPVRAAVVGRTQKEVAEAAETLHALDGVLPKSPWDTRLFTISGGAIGLTSGSAKASSFFHAHVSGLFDLVYVDPRIKLFATPYGQNFIARVNALANARGVLLLPDWQCQAAKGGVGPDQLADWLGNQGRPISNGHLSYPAQASLTPPPSVFSWYATHGTELTLAELLFVQSGEDTSSISNDPLVKEFLISDLSTTNDVRGARSGEDSSDVKLVLEDIVASHAYLLSGVSYKAALIRHILETLMPDRVHLDYADIGGGYGALAAELLLSCDPSRLSLAVTRDIARENIPLARSMYAGLINSINGRFKFSLGPAETFAFDNGFDVVSFIGSLLYVDKDELNSLLERVWSSIRPGGLLIVHENIKNSAFARDFDVMFEATELDQRLNRLAPIRYFHSSACVELNPDVVSDKTVFRVLTKSH